MSDLKIVRLPVKSIKPYKGNAKKHTKEQIDHIANSIKRFGFNDPIGVYGEDNQIVEGHGRYIASKQLGYSEVPCIRLDHMTDEERRAYTLAHNQTTLETPFDMSLLNAELDGILDIDMGEFGFDLAGEGEAELERTELSPYTKVHYLISAGVDSHDELLPYIEAIRGWGGAEIESTLN